MERHDAARYCPGCVGPSEGESGPCAYCGQPLLPLGTPDPRASVRCPSCARAVAGGATFCPHCGQAMAAVAAEGGEILPCPACAREAPGTSLEVFGLSPHPGRPEGYAVHACRRCGGAWVPTDTLQALVEQARRSEIPGAVSAGRGQAVRLDGPVVYRPCPACGEMMLRRNFARISGVITDTCRRHGTFFDAGELEAILDFVRGGGLARAARVEAEEQARESRARAAARPTPSSGPLLTTPTAGLERDVTHAAEIGALVVGATSAFLSWGARWVRERLGDE